MASAARATSRRTPRSWRWCRSCCSACSSSLAVFAIATWMHGHAPSPWWPHGWPLGAQMVAMVLAVDFMRYWLHRACHTYAPLWRLHEVHHSPDILYTLNVGRFHPLEKIAALRLRHRAVPAARRRARGDRRLLPALRGERLLPAQQPAPALRLAQLRRRQRRDASLAPRARSEDGLLQFRQHHDRLGSPLRHLVLAHRRSGGRHRHHGHDLSQGVLGPDVDAVPRRRRRRGGAGWPGGSPTSRIPRYLRLSGSCSAGGSRAPRAIRCASSGALLARHRSDDNRDTHVRAAARLRRASRLRGLCARRAR